MEVKPTSADVKILVGAVAGLIAWKYAPVLGVPEELLKEVCVAFGACLGYLTPSNLGKSD